MASTKQQEEKRIQFLRRMVALPHNRNCFDCGQRGPTYVNTTIGSFVCTACSGVLRGLNPPHRVKSISMGTFSQEEVDSLAERGNEYNRHVWLALHDTKEPPVIDTKDEIKLRDYMTQKYERKRWYSDPTPDLTSTAKVMNTQTVSKTSGSSSSVRRPVASGAGLRIAGPPGTIPKIQSLSTPTSTAPSSAPVSTVAAPGFTQQTSLVSASGGSSDLLSDIFASSAPPTSNNQTSTHASSDFQPNFANFGDISSSTSVPSSQSASAAANMGANSLFPTETVMAPVDVYEQPIDSIDTSFTTAASTAASDAETGSSQPAVANSSQSQWSSLSAVPSSDKYASLSGLFADDAPPGTTNGGGSGGLDWGSSSAASAPQNNAGGMNWGSTPSANQGQTGMSWGGPAPSQSVAAQAGGMFGQPQQAPVASGIGQQQWGMNAQSSGVNPFLVSSMAGGQASSGFGMGVQQQPPMNQQAAMAGFGGLGGQPFQAQTSLSTGFPYQQQQTPVSSANPFGGSAMGAMNTGFGSTQNGGPAPQWGAPAQTNNQWGSMPTSQQWGAPNNQTANQWGTTPTVSKPPTSVNPFLAQMSTGGIQSSSNNPFL